MSGMSGWKKPKSENAILFAPDCVAYRAASRSALFQEPNAPPQSPSAAQRLSCSMSEPLQLVDNPARGKPPLWYWSTASFRNCV